MQVRAALGERAADAQWLTPCLSAVGGFRNKAKMVVAGTMDEPTLGILDDHGHGVDLRECGLYPAAITDALPVLAQFITRARLEPYSVPDRRGELKHLLVTAASTGDLLLRFVMRSTEAHTRLVKHLPWLQDRLPHLRVATLNVLPEHRAVTEGEREIVLTAESTLAMPLGDLSLHLGPRSFFQTNTAVATDLYAQVREWIDSRAPSSLWDLYCGVGGFALHCLAATRAVVGVEVSEEAIVSAERSRAEALAAGLPGADAVALIAADAGAWAMSQTQMPDAVIVNPPRRGVGAEFAAWLEGSGIETIVYSSCNPATLARDLAAMPSYRVEQGRLFDMFPHTGHMEVAVLLVRVTPQDT